MVAIKRKTNIFEKILLVIGICLIIIGYIALHRAVMIEGSISWEFLQAVFLWVLMILLVILAAVNENMKEELKLVVQTQAEEVRLLRQDLKKRK